MILLFLWYKKKDIPDKSIKNRSSAPAWNIPLLHSGGGGRDGCENSAYIWRVVSWSSRGVWAVEAVGPFLKARRWYSSYRLSPHFPRMVLCQEDGFAVKVFSGSMLACIRNVFNWSLMRRFRPPRSLLPLASSPSTILRGSRAGCILGTWPDQRRRCMLTSIKR